MTRGQRAQGRKDWLEGRRAGQAAWHEMTEEQQEEFLASEAAEEGAAAKEPSVKPKKKRTGTYRLPCEG